MTLSPDRHTPGPAPLRLSEALAIFGAAAAPLWLGLFPSFLLALAQRIA